MSTPEQPPAASTEETVQLPQVGTRRPVTPPMPAPMNPAGATAQPAPDETAVLPAVERPSVPPASLVMPAGHRPAPPAAEPLAPAPPAAGVDALMDHADVPAVPAPTPAQRAAAIQDWMRRGDNGLVLASAFVALILLLVVVLG